MTEQDREAWNAIARGRDTTEHSHIRARLDYTDKLERALLWRDTEAALFQVLGNTLAAHGRSEVVVEAHDNSPRGRGEALVRLWERVTGGE